MHSLRGDAVIISTHKEITQRNDVPCHKAPQLTRASKERGIPSSSEVKSVFSPLRSCLMFIYPSASPTDLSSSLAVAICNCVPTESVTF